MSNTENPQTDNKRKKRWETIDAAHYDSGTGSFANNVDSEIVAEFIKGKTGRALDMPCGSGRFTPVLAQNLDVTSGDYSPTMLEFAAKHYNAKTVKVDAFNIQFDDNTFDVILCLRLTFHYNDCSPIIAQLARVTTPDGCILIDSLNTYSLRWLLAMPYNLIRGKGNRKVVFRTQKQMQTIFTENGLIVESKETKYILPTRMYRWLPNWLCILLEKLECLIPGKLLGLTFWTLKKAAG